MEELLWGLYDYWKVIVTGIITVLIVTIVFVKYYVKPSKAIAKDKEKDMNKKEVTKNKKVKATTTKKDEEELTEELPTASQIIIPVQEEKTKKPGKKEKKEKKVDTTASVLIPVEEKKEVIKPKKVVRKVKVGKGIQLPTQINKPFNNTIEYSTVLYILKSLNKRYKLLLFTDNTAVDPLYITTMDILDVVGNDIYGAEVRVEDLKELEGIKVSRLPYNGNKVMFRNDTVNYKEVNEHMEDDEYINSVLVTAEKTNNMLSHLIKEIQSNLVKYDDDGITWENLFHESNLDTYIGEHGRYILLTILQEKLLGGKGNIHNITGFKRNLVDEIGLDGLNVMVVLGQEEGEPDTTTEEIDTYITDWLSRYGLVKEESKEVRQTISEIEKIMYSDLEYGDKVTAFERLLGVDFPYDMSPESIEDTVVGNIQDAIRRVKMHKLRLSILQGMQEPSKWKLF